MVPCCCLLVVGRGAEMLPAGECRALPTITAGKSARAPQRGFWGLLGAAGGGMGGAFEVLR